MKKSAPLFWVVGACCCLLSAACGNDNDSAVDGGPGGDSGADTDTETHCVVFVDGSLADYTDHDGSGWALAFAAVQEGIDACAGVVDSGAFDFCEVWVASGTYTPTHDATGASSPSDPQALTFRLKGGVYLYGGFSGSEIALDERDIDMNETVLSGDIGIIGDSSDNAISVVTGATGAAIDGFTITGGHSGMRNENSSPTVSNCTFSHLLGSAMFNKSSSPTVKNCIFFENNPEGYSGGGMFNQSSAPTVTNCIFEGNSASYYGGGMVNEQNASPIVTNCTFSGNHAGYGGGMYNNSSSPTVINCAFSDNSSSFGGGMANEQNASPIVTNSIFKGNSAGMHGGGMYNQSASPTITNCIFESNSADSFGGGMANENDCFPFLANCTFSGNTATEGCGGIAGSNSLPTITNCILWGDGSNSDEEVVCGLSGVTTYSDVQGGCTVDSGCTTDETGNIDADPLFVNSDGEAGFIDLHLQSGSPCIDTGSAEALPADTIDLDGDGDISEKISLDLDGNPRVIGASVDMGAYEIL